MSQQERDRIMNEPLVRQVIDVFNARVIDIREAPKKIPSSDPPAAGADQES